MTKCDCLKGAARNPATPWSISRHSLQTLRIPDPGSSERDRHTTGSEVQHLPLPEILLPRSFFCRIHCKRISDQVGDPIALSNAPAFRARLSPQNQLKNNNSKASDASRALKRLPDAYPPSTAQPTRAHPQCEDQPMRPVHRTLPRTGRPGDRAAFSRARRRISLSTPPRPHPSVCGRGCRAHAAPIPGAGR